MSNRVAVLLCCYSGEPFFEDAVRSVTAQTHPDVELIFHDNGAPESYRRKIVDLAAEVGARVVRSEINRYGEGLRYDVVPHVEAEYVAILHDDDVYLPHKLERSLREMQERGLDYIFTDREVVDAELKPLAQSYDAVNTSPISGGDFPHRFLAEFFYTGLHLHFSTLVLTTALAKKTLLGDPFLPRISDAHFFAQLLLDHTVRGAALPERLTTVRIHGSNDFLYDKFAGERQGRELALLSLSEFFAFQELLRRAPTPLLARVLGIFPGIPVRPEDDRVDLLVRTALYLRPWHLGKKLMAAHCMHEAFRIAPHRAMRLVRENTDRDANREIDQLYNDFLREYGELLHVRGNEQFVTRQEHEATLAAFRSSTSWRVSAPVRWLARLVGRGGA